MVLGPGKTYCSIHLMTNRLYMTLMSRKEVSVDPWKLQDPNARERGLYRPPEVAPIAFLHHNITPYIFNCPFKLFLKVYWSMGELIVSSI